MAVFEIDEKDFLAKYRLRSFSPIAWEDEDYGLSSAVDPNNPDEPKLPDLRVVELEGWAGGPDPLGLRSPK